MKVFFVLLVLSSVVFYAPSIYGWGTVRFYELDAFDKNPFPDELDELALPPNTDIIAKWQTINECLVGHSYTVDFENDGIVEIEEKYTGGEGTLYGEFIMTTPAKCGEYEGEIIIKTDKEDDYPIGFAYIVVDTNVSVIEKNCTVNDDLKLVQNYPNPFNPITTIQFSLPQNEGVVFRVYNTKGDILGTKFINGSTGINSVSWNGSSFASGVYLYSIQTKNTKITKKMILLK